MNDVSEDLLLKTPEEKLAELQVEYAKAVGMLRAIRSVARTYARSGNPGRRSAGEDLLGLLS